MDVVDMASMEDRIWEKLVERHAPPPEETPPMTREMAIRIAELSTSFDANCPHCITKIMRREF